jgi:hypothetical protein
VERLFGIKNRDVVLPEVPLVAPNDGVHVCVAGGRELQRFLELGQPSIARRIDCEVAACGLPRLPASRCWTSSLTRSLCENESVSHCRTGCERMVERTHLRRFGRASAGDDKRSGRTGSLLPIDPSLA